MNSTTYAVVAPTGKTHDVVGVRQTEPLEDLSGLVIGEFWDYIFKGDIMFPMFREGLRHQFKDVSFAEYPIFGNTHGLEETDVVNEIPRLLREHRVQAVISGVGC